MTGEWLKNVRTEAGLSQAELAMRLGVHRNSIGLYEGGADMPFSLFLRICEEMGKHPSHMLFEMLAKEELKKDGLGI